MRLLSVLGIWILCVGLVAIIAVQEGKSYLESKSNRMLTEVSARLEIELDKYRTLPKVLTLHPVIETALLKTTPEIDQDANLLLARYNNSLSSEAVYLIDATGVTIASSNWDQANSFVGSDYHFRPYFQQAMMGNEGSYFALGTVSKQRGYYFSQPVRRDDEVLGVLVIKVSLTAIEDGWSGQGLEFLLTDIYGVVFYGSQAEWNYKALASLPVDVEQQLIEQRQYDGMPIQQLTDFANNSDVLNSKKFYLPFKGSSKSFYQTHKDMSPVGWRLFALTPVNMINQIVFWSLAVATVFFVLFYLVSFYWRRTVDAQKQLAAINEELEHRVETRTTELRQSNNQLISIIDKQKQTEKILKETQFELIQAGKLALLGEMSASINHELNQPLTAMRTYTETLLMMVSKGKLDNLEHNAQEILKLNKMMAKIVGQYKLFARKSVGKMGPVCIQEILSASLSILDAKMQKIGVKLDVEGKLAGIQVLAESVPLEQVLVNLLNNALQACVDTDIPAIDIKVEHDQNLVTISVADNGPGFPQGVIEHVFEPFYTTKGQGLGLGLTISKRIVESFGGTIGASNGAVNGAVFTVILARFKEDNKI
ncbi:ATP-binding protein [Aliiglaciecola sp. LCG003]|uniref:ATP-binding protein n=1 Tax=Aliiglaciecola sp. LCG003 TaxID=3053655 RepID=UPI00257237D6|nr:ATP-binding protein [Aliiglaciecola sp. LCG003]WJG10343.1 ATP-binding protein [Aliiglaciecola sp. LCG003]